jgi:hypothetical protein
MPLLSYLEGYSLILVKKNRAIEFRIHWHLLPSTANGFHCNCRQDYIYFGTFAKDSWGIGDILGNWIARHHWNFIVCVIIYFGRNFFFVLKMPLANIFKIVVSGEAG